MTDFILHPKRDDIRDNCIAFIKSCGNTKAWKVTIEEYEKTRTTIRNAHYWANLTDLIEDIRKAVERIAEYTGHSPLEVKREIAKGMTPEDIALLFTKNPEGAHDVLKEIAGIPTSTKLGTRKFIAFEDRMIQIMSDIAGHVQAFEARAT